MLLKYMSLLHKNDWKNIKKKEHHSNRLTITDINHFKQK